MTIFDYQLPFDTNVDVIKVSHFYVAKTSKQQKRLITKKNSSLQGKDN